MKKAKIDSHMKNRVEAFIEEQLQFSNHNYFAIKSSHVELRQTALESLASALAEHNKSDKLKKLKQLRSR
jgi:hypothetical protein